MKRALIALLLIISFLQAGITFGTGSKVNFGNANVGVYGSLKNQGTITYLSTSKLSFVGSALDTLTNIYTFPNLIVNKPAGNLRLNNSTNNFLLTGDVSFTQGNILTGTNTFELGVSATVTGETATKYISGTVKAARLIGTGTSAGTGNFGGIGYSITNTGADLGTVTVFRYTGDGSEVSIYGTEGIWRKWTVATSNAFSGTRTVTSNWLSNEDNGNNLTALKVWKYEPVKSSDEDTDISELRKLILKKNDITAANSKGIEESENTIHGELEYIVVEPDAESEDSKNLFWVEVDGSTFNTTASPRTATYTINAATSYTVCSASNAFADGSGTEGNPYQVATLTQLNNVRNYPTACFIQIANIDASATSGWNAGAGWLPIGNTTTKFTGKYNGQGYTVSGLYVSRSATSYNGLFGYAQGTIISNVKLTGLNIVGGAYTGGLVGYNYSGALIVGCSADGAITGTNYVGGLVGRNETSIINNSYSKGTVTGTAYVGGLAGLNYITCEINNCYTQANVLRVSGGTSTYVAGFTSYNYTSKIINSYSTGSVTYIDTTNPTNRGFVAIVSTGTGYAMTGNFWNTETSGQTTNGAGTATGLTKNQMRTLSIFTNATWDFQGESVNGTSDIWGINAVTNSGYPFLSWEGITHRPSPFAGGIGISEEPFLVSNLTQLDSVRGFLNYSFLQTADIDATPTAGWKSGGWLPIGNATTKFTGVYDGQEYAIDGLFINRATLYNGLFGYTQGSTISNLDLTNVNITSTTNYTGGLAGYHNLSSDVLNCSVQGTVTGYDYTGGLIGYNVSSSTIAQSSSNGVFTGNNYVGGLVGWSNTSSIISNSFSKGEVFGYNYTGGFSGLNYTSSSISNSYSLANVSRVSGSANTYFGGFSSTNSSSTITNCYSTGKVIYVNSTNPTTKGFSAYNATCTLSGNFWNTETSNQTTSAGTETGLNNSQMRTLSTFTSAGWDFYGESVNGTNDYWNIHTSLNSGYPYLNWEYRLAVEAPANLVLTVSGTNVVITWDPVTNAAGYLVYSSVNPYGTFVLNETGSFIGTEWTGTLTGTRNFYYVTAVNDTKVVPSKTIMINNLYMNK